VRAVGAGLRYCPSCGGDLEMRLLPGERVLQPCCRACGFVLWQNPKPVVAALVTRSEAGRLEVLLGRRNSEPGKGLWHVPGGFVDPGETAEEALVRECQEELGCPVEPVEFLGAYPDRYGEEPILVLAYRCRLVQGCPRTSSELGELGWFSVHETPGLAFGSCERALGALRARARGAG
jgi:8-oxo-dGTP diphosphatase